MSKLRYLPTSDQGKATWLNNFSTKLPSHAVPMGVSGAEVTSVQNDAAAFAYWMQQIETLVTEKEERVVYKNILRNGKLGSPTPPTPTMPALPASPTAVQPGIFRRIGLLVQRIKSNLNYGTSIGIDLGIVGSEHVINIATLKPKLKLVFTGGAVKVQWKKGIADAIKIECDRGSGWTLAGIDSIPHFTDTTPITAPATWKYKAIYLISDKIAGQWSDEASIAVGA